MTSVSPRSRRDSGNKSSSSHASQKKGFHSFKACFASHVANTTCPTSFALGTVLAWELFGKKRLNEPIIIVNFFCSGLPRLHEIQSMDLLGGYPTQILPFFDE